MPIRTDLTVATVYALADVHVSEYHNGANAWVVQENTYFILNKSSGATPDANTIQPVAGSPRAGLDQARWLRETIIVPPVTPGSTTLAWFISPANGNDSASGTSQSDPIKTLTEWFRRVSAVGGIAAGGLNVVVNIMGDIPATDEPRGVLNIYGTSNIRFSGNLGIATVRTGTLTPVTTRVASTNTPWQGTDSLGATWTAFVISTTHQGYRVRNTTAGARLNSTFWPAKDLTAGACRFCSPLAAVTYLNGPFSVSLSTIVNGDTYALELLPQMNSGWGIQFNCDGYDQIVANFEAVQFNELSFPAGTSGRVPSFIMSGSQSIGFYNCFMGFSRILSAGQYFYIGCGWTGSSQLLGFQNLYAGLFIGDMFVNTPALIDLECMAQGGASGISFHGNCGAILASFQSYDATNGILLDRMGSMSMLPIFGSRLCFGTSTGSNFIRIKGGSLANYATNATGITGLGSGGAGTAIGMGAAATSVAYAALPNITSDIAAGTGTTFAGLILQG